MKSFFSYVAWYHACMSIVLYLWMFILKTTRIQEHWAASYILLLLCIVWDIFYFEVIRLVYKKWVWKAVNLDVSFRIVNWLWKLRWQVNLFMQVIEAQWIWSPSLLLPLPLFYLLRFALRSSGSALLDPNIRNKIIRPIRSHAMKFVGS